MTMALKNLFMSGMEHANAAPCGTACGAGDK